MGNLWKHCAELLAAVLVTVVVPASGCTQSVAPPPAPTPTAMLSSTPTATPTLAATLNPTLTATPSPAVTSPVPTFTPTPADTPTAIPASGLLAGTVAFDSGHVLSAGTRVSVEIRGVPNTQELRTLPPIGKWPLVGSSDDILAAETHSPFRIAIPYSFVLVDPERRYVSLVRIYKPDGELIYVNERYEDAIVRGVPRERTEIELTTVLPITGVVVHHGSETVPKGAEVSIEFRSTGNSTSWDDPGGASFTIEEETDFPIRFSVPYDPLILDWDAYYIPHITILGPTGDVLFENWDEITPWVIYARELNSDVEVEVAPTVSGVITFSGGGDLAEDAFASVKLRDVTNETGVHRVSIRTPNSFPIPFYLRYNSRRIDPQDTYALSVVIKKDFGSSCRVLYANDSQEVITHGNPSHGIQLEVAAVSDPPDGPLATVTGIITSGISFEEAKMWSRDGWREKPGVIRLYDVERRCTIGAQEIGRETAFPIPFSISYHSAEVDPSATYALSVDIPLWSTRSHFDHYGDHPDWWDGPTPLVLTNGHPSTGVAVEAHYWSGRI